MWAGATARGGPSVRRLHFGNAAASLSALGFCNPPQRLADVCGAHVDAVIDKIEAAVAAYPHDAEYRTWPGPTGNTFTAHIARQVPEQRLDLPPGHRQGLPRRRRPVCPRPKRHRLANLPIRRLRRTRRRARRRGTSSA